MTTPDDWLAKMDKNCFGHMTKIATMLIYSKNSGSQMAGDLETWYVALGLLGLQSLFK